MMMLLLYSSFVLRLNWICCLIPPLVSIEREKKTRENNYYKTGTLTKDCPDYVIAFKYLLWFTDYIVANKSSDIIMIRWVQDSSSTKPL